MVSDNVFPRLQSANVPHLTKKIFTHVNYMDDVTRFRLVCCNWANYIHMEMLTPDMKQLLKTKEFVYRWTKKPLVKEDFLEKEGYEVSDKKDTDVNIWADYITIHDPNLRRMYIYKTSNLVGYISTDHLNPPYFIRRKYEFHTSISFIIDWNDHFIDYFRLSDCWDNGKPFLKINTFSKQPNDNLELLPSETITTISTAKRQLLWYLPSQRPRRGVKPDLLLICQETSSNNIIIINLQDQSEKTVCVSRVGHSYTTCAVDCDIVADGSDLFLFWKREHFLQLIDLSKGEEIWVQDAVRSPLMEEICINRDFLKPRLVVTSKYICILNADAEREKRELHFHDRRSGQIITCFSTREGPSIFPDMISSFGAGKTFAWTTENVNCSFFAFDVKERRLTCQPRMHCQQCQNPLGTFRLVETIKDRIVLLEWHCWPCHLAHLVVHDLLKKPMVPVILDRQPGLSVYRGILRGNNFKGEKVLCCNSLNKMTTLTF